MERLGLESASTPKKRPGRPTFQQQWEKAILRAISVGKWAEVDVLQTSKVPAWYGGGNTLQPKVEYEATGHVVADAVLQLAGASEQDAAAQEAEAEALEAEDAAAQEAEAAAQEAVASCSTPKKRPRTFVPEAAKVWFVSWSTRLEEKGWSRLACFKVAQELCPEVFGTLNLNSTYRWGGGKSTEAQMEKDKGGRPSKLPPALCEVLATLITSLRSQGLPVTGRLAMNLFKEALLKEGCVCSISLSWSHRFLLSMGLSYKSSTGQSTCMHTPQEKETNIRLLKLRLCWSRHEHSVPPNRVFNIDETARRLLPLPTRSWQRAGERPVVLSHRAFTTVTLVCSADPSVPLAAQLMFEGKTDRVLPVTAAKENRHVCRNEKHWASQETVFALLQYITNGCAPHDCIVILDMAPVHYAKSLCDRVRAELSTCHLLYVPRGATSYAQPLDISYMRGFKAEVAQFASQALAADLLQDADVRGMIRKLPKVRNQLVDLVDKALLNMDNGTHHKRGWAHLLCSEDDFAGCVDEARALHSANLLWENAPELPDAFQTC